MIVSRQLTILALDLGSSSWTSTNGCVASQTTNSLVADCGTATSIAPRSASQSPICGQPSGSAAECLAVQPPVVIEDRRTQAVGSERDQIAAPHRAAHRRMSVNAPVSSRAINITGAKRLTGNPPIDNLPEDKP